MTYVVQPSQDSAVANAVADHAYWVSNVTARDLKASSIGTVDIRSEGFGVGDPAPTGVSMGAGTLNGGYHGPMAYTSREQEWGAVPAAPVRDALDIKATNVATVAIDPTRARVDCAAQLNVTSDGPLTIEFAGCGAPLRFPAGHSSRVAGTCTSRRRFRVRLPNHRGRIVRAVVFLAGKRVGAARARGPRRSLTHVVVDLRGRPLATFPVQIRMRVVRRGRARTITRRHTYHTCIARRRSAKRGAGRHRKR